MINSFSDPCQVTVIDDRPGKHSGSLNVPDKKLFGAPDWVEEDTMLGVIGEDEADTIALLDVSDPAQGKVKEVLWTRGKGLDVTPLEAAYSRVTRRCIFAASQEGKGCALYAFQRGQAEPPQKLEQGLERVLANPAFSPDGRYLLFRSDRTDRRRVADRP